MWHLTSDHDDRVIYVSPQTEIVIGRSAVNEVCNFAIPDDLSISRKHATLTITDNNLYLQDLGSRYGTFVNDAPDKVEVNNNIKLKSNDVVKFGKLNSIWKVNYMSLNTCTSTLKGENLQKLKQTLSKIGAVLKNEWDDTCNYLTMPAITLTIKVVLALVQGSHIVTTEYWEKFLESVQNFSALPNPHDFMPNIVESTLNKEVVSFSPDERRKSLFNGKKFIFFSRRQYEMYKPVLVTSGANPLLLSECKMTVSMLCEQNVVVIQFVTSGATQESQAQRNQINEIVTQLKNKGKRVIADAEIGLAILYCSIEKYCNPSFSFTSEVVKQTPGPVSRTTSKVLAQESQEYGLPDNGKENVEINESADDKSHIEKQVTKRKLSEFTSEIQFNPNKKVATSCAVANIPNESSKRKLSGEQPSTNPYKKMALDKENNDQGSSNSSEDILIEKDKSDDMFNFINPATDNGSQNKTKKLNLTKPQKRKMDAAREDGDLFNFVQTDDDAKDSQGEISKQSIFSSNKMKRTDDMDKVKIRNSVTVTPEDISAMRGVKLKELMASHKTEILDSEEIKVKQEKTEELEQKMGGLDLGNTIVITCNNLIVKKEPFKTEPDDTFSSVKNFKKFKKVWPVRKQGTIIPISSMVTADLTDTNSYSMGV